MTSTPPDGPGLDTGDPHGEGHAAWQLERDHPRCRPPPTVDRARETLELLYAWADSGEAPEVGRFARTVGRWETGILNWHTTGGASNGPTEAVNLAIKQIKRVGRGFRNFANYRLRLLLHCGVTWHDNRAANLRRHAPRFIA